MTNNTRNGIASDHGQRPVLFGAYDTRNIVNGVNTWLMRLLPYLMTNQVDIHVAITPLFNRGEEGPGVLESSLLSNEIPVTLLPRMQYLPEQVEALAGCLNKLRPSLHVPGNHIAGINLIPALAQNQVSSVGIAHNDDSVNRAIMDLFAIRKGHQDLFVGVSRHLGDIAFAKKAANTAVTIPYGVELPKDRVAGPNEVLNILYAGRLSETQKRITETVQALCHVVETIPNTFVNVLGGGEEEGRLRKLITEKSLQNRIRIHGHQDPAFVKEVTRQSHVFVLLSDWEGIPLSLMEAMAHGLVPVCTRIESGIPELITDGDNGFLIDHRMSGTAACIGRLRKDKSLWESMSEKARDRILEGFCTTHCFELWLDLIRKNLAPVGSWKAIPPLVKLRRPDNRLGWMDKRPRSRLKRVYDRIERTLFDGRAEE